MKTLGGISMNNLFNSAAEVIEAINQAPSSIKGIILKEILSLPIIRQDIWTDYLLDIEEESIPASKYDTQAIYDMSDEDFFNHYLDYYHGEVDLEDLIDSPYEESLDSESDDIDRLIMEQELYGEDEE